MQNKWSQQQHHRHTGATRPQHFVPQVLLCLCRRHLQTHRCNTTATFRTTNATVSLSTTLADTPVQHDRNISYHKCYRVSVDATCRHTGATRPQHFVPQVLLCLCRRHLQTHRCNTTATFGATSATVSLSTPLADTTVQHDRSIWCYKCYRVYVDDTCTAEAMKAGN